MDVAIVPSERASCRLHAAGKKCACHPCLCLPSFPKVFTSVHFSSSSPNLTFRKNEKKKNGCFSFPGQWVWGTDFKWRRCHDGANDGSTTDILQRIGLKASL